MNNIKIIDVEGKFFKFIALTFHLMRFERKKTYGLTKKLATIACAWRES